MTLEILDEVAFLFVEQFDNLYGKIKTEPASYLVKEAGSARYASGSLLITIFSFAMFTTVSRLHFGQYSGKYSNTTSS